MLPQNHRRYTSAVLPTRFFYLLILGVVFFYFKLCDEDADVVLGEMSYEMTRNVLSMALWYYITSIILRTTIVRVTEAASSRSCLFYAHAKEDPHDRVSPWKYS